MPDFSQSPFLSTIRDLIPEPPLAERRALVDQLILGIDGYYAHLPQKRSAHAIEPVDGLSLLRASSGPGFNRGLLTLLSALRDRHTTLKLAAPWTNVVAYVPFIVEQFWQDGRPRYIVGKQLFGFEEIPVGSLITHWNGSPIDLVVRRLGAQSQGANEGAAMQLGLANLCIRPLAFVLMPDEDWVTLTYYDAAGRLKTSATPWRFYLNQPAPSVVSTARGAAAALIGIDEATYERNRFKSHAITRPPPPEETTPALASEGQIRFGTIRTTAGDVAYLRIFSFEVPDAVAFVNAVASKLASLPQNRLIIDIRGNPGGLIPSGQKLIRILTRKPLTRSPVSFRSTSRTLELGQNPQFSMWQPSLAEQWASGSAYSQAFPLSDYEDVPDYRYPGKVALIIDGLSYSTSDFFAADFKDNELGPVVGIDATTGGGGANVWSWPVLCSFAAAVGDRGPQPLPPGYDFNLAVRRSYRTGAKDGMPVEELGVAADHLRRLTLKDLVSDNADLLEFTASLLK